MIELDGKLVINNLGATLKEKVIKNNVIPKLAIVQVGSDLSSVAYINIIKKVFTKAGAATKITSLDAGIEKEKFKEEIKLLNKDKNNDGILILTPLPNHLSDVDLNDLMDEAKDVDCATKASIANLFTEKKHNKSTCTAEAIIELLDYYNIQLEGKNITVVGRSVTVGKPISLMLLNRNATVTVCHSKTKDLVKECKKSDILIVAAGVPNLITKKHVNENQIVIDVGTNYLNGKFYGDVNHEDVKNTVKMITAKYNGIGIITTYILLKHTIDSALQRKVNKK